MSHQTGLQSLRLDPDPVAALGGVPAKAGVAQLLDEAGRSLVIAQPANLRRWAARQLGLAARPRAASRRPALDLSGVARVLRYEALPFAFERLLRYERLLGEHVPIEKRRDLRVPGWLRLDLAARFPRVEAVALEGERSVLYGPFRDRKAAARARDAVHKERPLRPCDYVFEPDPALALGLGCLYAQIGSCAAPCLARVSEDAYRSLAVALRDALASDGVGPSPVWRPEWLSRAAGDRALVVEPGRKHMALFPVRDGVVLDEALTVVSEQDLDDAVPRLAWPAPAADRNDWPWLTSWLHAPRRKAVWLVVREGLAAPQIADRVRQALQARK